MDNPRARITDRVRIPQGSLDQDDQFLRVKLSAGSLALADAEDVEIGILDQPHSISGDQDVAPRQIGGSFPMVAAKAITAYTLVYPAAAGKVTDAATTRPEIAIALETATIDGDVIECLWIERPQDLPE